MADQMDAPPKHSEVQLQPVRFTKKGCDGDYNWMIKQPSYDDAFFVVLENFLDMKDVTSGNGGGTAVLRLHCHNMRRPSLKQKTIRAVGIPTGWSAETGGFIELSDTVKCVIDIAFQRLINHLDNMPKFKRLIYSCDDEDKTLIGTGIFKGTLVSTVIE